MQPAPPEEGDKLRRAAETALLYPQTFNETINTVDIPLLSLETETPYFKPQQKHFIFIFRLWVEMGVHHKVSISVISVPKFPNTQRSPVVSEYKQRLDFSAVMDSLFQLV